MPVEKWAMKNVCVSMCLCVSLVSPCIFPSALCVSVELTFSISCSILARAPCCVFFLGAQ